MQHLEKLTHNNTSENIDETWEQTFATYGTTIATYTTSI
jgi:hypothetical protein